MLGCGLGGLGGGLVGLVRLRLSEKEKGSGDGEDEGCCCGGVPMPACRDGGRGVGELAEDTVALLGGDGGLGDVLEIGQQHLAE